MSASDSDNESMPSPPVGGGGSNPFDLSIGSSDDDDHGGGQATYYSSSENSDQEGEAHAVRGTAIPESATAGTDLAAHDQITDVTDYNDGVDFIDLSEDRRLGFIWGGKRIHHLLHTIELVVQRLHDMPGREGWTGSKSKSRCAGARSFAEFALSPDLRVGEPALTKDLSTKLNVYYGRETILVRQSKKPAPKYAVAVAAFVCITLALFDKMNLTTLLVDVLVAWARGVKVNHKKIVSGLVSALNEVMESNVVIKHFSLYCDHYAPVNYAGCSSAISTALGDRRLTSATNEGTETMRIEKAMPKRRQVPEEHSDTDSVPRRRKEPEQPKVGRNFSIMMDYNEEFTPLCQALFETGEESVWPDHPSKRIFMHTVVVLLGALGCRATDFRYATIGDLTNVIMPSSDSETQDVYLAITLKYNKGQIQDRWTGGANFVYPDMNDRSRCAFTAIAEALTIIPPDAELTKDSEFISLLWSAVQGKMVRLYGNEGTGKHGDQLNKLFHQAMDQLPSIKRQRLTLNSIRKMFATTMGSRALYAQMQIFVDARSGHADARKVATHSQAAIHYTGIDDNSNRYVGRLAANRHRYAPPGDPCAQFLIDNAREELTDIVWDHYPGNLIEFMGIERLLPFAAYLCLSRRVDTYSIDAKWPALQSNDLAFHPMPDFTLPYMEALCLGHVKPLQYSYRRKAIEDTLKVIVVQQKTLLSMDQDFSFQSMSTPHKETASYSDRHSSAFKNRTPFQKETGQRDHKKRRPCATLNELTTSTSKLRLGHAEVNGPDDQSKNVECLLSDDEEGISEIDEPVPTMSEWAQKVFNPLHKSHATAEKEAEYIAKALNVFTFNKQDTFTEKLQQIVELWKNAPGSYPRWLPMSRWESVPSKYKKLKKRHKEYQKGAIFIIEEHQEDFQQAVQALTEMGITTTNDLRDRALTK